MPRYYIEELDESPAYERCESFGMGMDAYTRSTLLAPAAYQYGKNSVLPNGMELRTRPGVALLGANFGTAIQGLLYFDAPSPTPTVDYEQLLCATNAALSYWNGAAWTAVAGFTALATATEPMAAAQGVNTVLISGGVNAMQIWDGAALSNPGSGPTDPPVGATILLWHASRMWAMGFAGQTAGKENDAVWGSNILDFGAGAWNGVDRQFQIGGGDGDGIVGAASLSSSLENGFVMAIGKANSLWLVNTDPRETFTNFAAQMGPQKLSDGVGFVGKRSFAVVGNDLYFVSPDRTFRSLARMQAAQGQYQMSEDLSLPIKTYVDRINWTYAYKIAVVKYKDFVLFAVPFDASTYPNMVFAWNERLKKWCGLWSGTSWSPMAWEVTRFLDVHRLVFGSNAGAVNLWNDFSSVEDDDSYLDQGAAIATEFWSRSFLFGEPLNNKDALAIEIRLRQSNALITATLVFDDVDVFTWQIDGRAQGPNLEINLEFDLTADGNRAFPMGLRDLISFNECYLKLSSTEGWFSVRNISMSAFVNALQTT